MLLEEFNCSLDEVNNVSVYFAISITALKQPSYAISQSGVQLSYVFEVNNSKRDTGFPSN